MSERYRRCVILYTSPSILSFKSGSVEKNDNGNTKSK